MSRGTERIDQVPGLDTRSDDTSKIEWSPSKLETTFVEEISEKRKAGSALGVSSNDWLA